jgi:SAM-dependent methyltransferase
MKQKAADGWDTAPGAHGTIHREGRSKGETGKPVLMTTTLGWQASCECHDEHGRTLNPVPCTVLDPFLGSGTTVAVARELGRHGVGCEINPEYVKLARERIGKAEKPTTYRSEKVEDSPLFAECNP